MKNVTVLVRAVAPVVRGFWLRLRNWRASVSDLLRRDFQVQMLEPRALLSSISGTVYNDAAAEQAEDTNTGLSGVTVYLDQNNNGSLDSGETSTTTDSSGNYSFSSVPAGTTTLRAQAPSGYINEGKDTTNSDGSITLDLGGSETLTDVSLYTLRTLLPPQHLTATAVGTTGASLSWLDPNWNGDSGTHIYYSVDGGSFTLLATVSAGTSTYSATGLDLTAHDYVFRAAAYDGDGESDYSNTTDPNAPTAKVTSPVEVIVDESNGAITLKWSSDQDVDWHIFRSDTTGVYATVYASSATSNAGHYDYTFTDTNITPGDDYSYQVVPFKAVLYGSGGGSFSNGSGGASSGDVGAGSGETGVWVYYHFPFNLTQDVISFGDSPTDQIATCSFYVGYSTAPQYEGLTADDSEGELLWLSTSMVIQNIPCLGAGSYVSPSGTTLYSESSNNGTFAWSQSAGEGNVSGQVYVSASAFASAYSCGFADAIIAGAYTQRFHYTRV